MEPAGIGGCGVVTGMDAPSGPVMLCTDFTICGLQLAMLIGCGSRESVRDELMSPPLRDRTHMDPKFLQVPASIGGSALLRSSASSLKVRYGSVSPVKGSWTGVVLDPAIACVESRTVLAPQQGRRLGASQVPDRPSLAVSQV